MDSQIKLTSLKISQSENQVKILEQDIIVLSGKIVRLDGSLNDLSKILLSRVEETYKTSKIDTLTLLLSSKSFSGFISHYRYLQAVQLHDRELLLSMEQTRTNYDEQKTLKQKAQDDLEKLRKQLETQKTQLNSQILERKRLLDDTKGKEANYQKLLEDARNELAAITGILAGKGSEIEVRKVSEGERIAAVIQGASCNSSGTHLHFMVSKDGSTYNPFTYLKGGIDSENVSGGDAFNPSGSWNWPVSPKITLSQGYGYTWAVQNTWVGRIYQFHNGIDIKGSSSEIKAVKPGTLFQGSYNGRCSLHYVRVHLDDGGLDTYYLHVNY
jgi:septal ring factor EnvC (AmiA/AmiB activator)